MNPADESLPEGPSPAPAAHRNPRSARELALRALPLVFSLGLLATLLVCIQDFAIFRRIHVPWLVGTILISLALNVLLGAYKWRSVISLSRIPMGYRETLHLWMGMYPLVFFTPFLSGHLLYVLALKNAKKLSYMEASESVAYDMFVNVGATFTLILLGQLILDRSHFLSQWWIGCFAFLVVLFYMLDERALRWLGRFRFIHERSRLWKKRTRLRSKLVLLVLAVVYQSTDVLSMYLACVCLGVSVPVCMVFGVFPIIALLSHIPVTFSGFGSREAMVVVCMGGVLTYDQSVAAGLLVSLIEYLGPALIGLPCVSHSARLVAQGTHGYPAPIESTTWLGP